MISYEVLSLDPFTIQESSAATRSACGAAYLDQGFENLLRKKVGTKAEAILTPKNLRSALDNFQRIKGEFDPYSDDSELVYEFFLRGAPEMPDIGLEEGYLKVSKHFLSNASLMIGQIF